MVWAKKTVKFSLKDIGSELIDQLSRDIYTEPESILREVVKNAYDSFCPRTEPDPANPDEAPNPGKHRINISCDRGDDGVGHILVADNGRGQDLATLKGNLQIGISRKREEYENA